MKAKELVKFFNQHPNAEVVFDQYIGIHTTASVQTAELYIKGERIPDVNHSSTGAVENTGTSKVDVILIKS